MNADFNVMKSHYYQVLNLKGHKSYGRNTILDRVISAASYSGAPRSMGCGRVPTTVEMTLYKFMRFDNRYIIYNNMVMDDGRLDAEEKQRLTTAIFSRRYGRLVAFTDRVVDHRIEF